MIIYDHVVCILINTKIHKYVNIKYIYIYKYYIYIYYINTLQRAIYFAGTEGRVLFVITNRRVSAEEEITALRVRRSDVSYH